MSEARNAARVAYTEALAAMKQWSDANEKRMAMAAQVGAEGVPDDERGALALAYQQLCEAEMLYGGFAIVAISKAQEMTMQAYDELAPLPLLSAPSDTTMG
jgi:hypothetical protein